jgi:hypothetical protein
MSCWKSAAELGDGLLASEVACIVDECNSEGISFVFIMS